MPRITCRSARSTASRNSKPPRRPPPVDRRAAKRHLLATAVRHLRLIGQTRTAIRQDIEMEKFTVLEGVAAPLKIINVDTDMIIPKQYLKTIKRTWLGKGLFYEQRFR